MSRRCAPRFAIRVFAMTPLTPCRQKILPLTLLKNFPDRSSKVDAHGSGELGPSAEERMAAGKALRERVPRTSQACGNPADRPDPIAAAEARRPRTPRGALLPIRYGRMRQSPFAFFRGSAALMAADLAATLATRTSRAGLRRLPRGEFRRLRQPGTPAGLRHQRFRRNASRAVGMGREAPGGEHRAGRPRDRSERDGIAPTRRATRCAPTANTCASTPRCARSKCGIRIWTRKSSSTKRKVGRGAKALGAASRKARSCKRRNTYFRRSPTVKNGRLRIVDHAAADLPPAGNRADREVTCATCSSVTAGRCPKSGA